MFNYVRVRMAGDDAAEDVVSEAFLRAARAFDRFDPKRAKFSTWVVRIATNCMNDYYRKARLASALDDVPEAVLAQPAEQEQLADRDLVDKLLSCLSVQEREIVVLKYREGYRNVDIATELDMNASTVATVLSRALSKMRDAMESEQRS